MRFDLLFTSAFSDGPANPQKGEHRMNYEQTYQQLISKHGHVSKPDDGEYYERHHVIPKSLGGADTADNLVYLSGKAHYVAHYLLYKAHGIGPMSHAFWCMSAMGTSGKRHVPNGRSFEVARKAMAEAASKVQTGKKLSDEHKAKMSAAHKGKKLSDEHKAKLAKSANVYNYKTDKLIAEGVVLNNWCRENGYSQGQLSDTTRADRTKPHHWRTNRHQTKGVYARYI